jgi:hypothetical protein
MALSWLLATVLQGQGGLYPCPSSVAGVRRGVVG